MTQAFKTSNTFRDNLKTKNITIFINGKNQHYACEINPKVTKTWSEVLTFVGSIINPQFGSVKKLIALSSLQPVNSINLLNSKEKYIALGEGEKFKRAPNGYIISSKEEIPKKSGSPSIVRRQGAVADIKSRRSTKELQPVSVSKETPKNEINTNLTVKVGYNNSPEIKIGQQKPSNDKKGVCRYFKRNNQRNSNQKEVPQQNKDAGQKRFGKQTGKNISKESTPCVNKEKTISEGRISQPQRKALNKGFDESKNNQDDECANKEKTISEVRISQPQRKAINKELDESRNNQEYPLDAVEKIETKKLVHTCISPIKPPPPEKIHSTTSPIHDLYHIENPRSNKDINKKKNIFQPSPTTSIKNITLISSSSSNNPKSEMVTTYLAEISPNKVPQVVPPIQKLVIPHEAISKRMQDLKETIVAYKRNISQINKRICDECKKCENAACLNDCYSKDIKAGLPKPNSVKKSIKDSASVETLEM